MINLTKVLTDYGLHVDYPELDGQIHRCKHNGSKDLRGWYTGIQLSADKIYCTYGSWDGETQKYLDSSSELTHNDFNIIKINTENRKKERAILYKKASENAKGLINILPIASIDHPYLQKKQVQPHDILQKKDVLIIPIIDQNKTITSYQKIFPDGSKKMLYGGRKAGCCSIINGDSMASVVICEGWATGASINEATGIMVLVAIDAGNMIKVVDLAIKKLPNRKIYLCADNDHTKEKNIGVETAKKIIDKYPWITLRIPEGIDGTDYNDMALELGLDKVKSEIFQEPCIVTTNDIKEDNDDISIHIPEELMMDGGLIETGMLACNSTYIPKIDQFNFPVVLSLLSNAMSGKIVFSKGRIWPNFYNIKVGGTSTGKTDSDKFWKNTLKDYGIKDFYGSTDFSSGPGLFRGLVGQSQCLMCLDEISYLFKRFDRPDPISSGKIQALLELHTNAGQEIKKAYGDSKNSILISDPCLNIIGNATTTIFDDLRPEDFETGLIQRFDFWTYGGKIPYRSSFVETDEKLINIFMSCLYELHNYKNERKSSTDLAGALNQPNMVEPDHECNIAINNFSIENIDLCNKQTSEGKVGIISRRYHASIKYAMNYMISERILLILKGKMSINDLFKPMEVRHFLKGKALAIIQADWKLTVLYKKVSMGMFHRDCNIFKDAILSCLQASRPLTGKSIANRRPIIKSWNPKHYKDVIKALSARKEIKIDESKKNTQYFLLKD